MCKQRNESASSLARTACVVACVALLASATEARWAAARLQDVRPTTARASVAQRPPLTKGYLLGALRRGRPRKSELVRLVGRRGVNFELTARDESRMRKAGASDKLIEAVRAHYNPPHLPTPAIITVDPALSSPGQETVTGGCKISADDRRAYPDTYSADEVTRKARITFMPAPSYTEEGRKNSVTGTVTLCVIFSASGKVTNIRAIKSLPDGLTERAIAAAAQIRFTPAEKDGRAVSQWVSLDYQFHIY